MLTDVRIDHSSVLLTFSRLLALAHCTPHAGLFLAAPVTLHCMLALAPLHCIGSLAKEEVLTVMQISRSLCSTQDWGTDVSTELPVASLTRFVPVSVQLCVLPVYLRPPSRAT